MQKALLVSGLFSMIALSAQAQTPPRVLHWPDANFEAGLPGTYTLDLELVTGYAFTPEVSDQAMCKNGVGDESCGTFIVLTTTGDTTITSFSEAGPEVSGNRVSSTELRIVKLSATGSARPGDWGQVPLGQVVVNRASSGTLNVDTRSNFVAADLTLTPMTADTTPVPEPSEWLLLAAGLGSLALLDRLRVGRHGECR